MIFTQSSSTDVPASSRELGLGKMLSLFAPPPPRSLLRLKDGSPAKMRMYKNKLRRDVYMCA